MAARGRRLALTLAATSAALASAASGADERPAPRLVGHLYAPRLTGYHPQFLYDADHFAVRWTLRSDRSLFDLPTARRARFGRTRDVGTVPGTLDGGNAGVEFARFRRPGRAVAVVDSFGRPFAYLRQSPADPEAVTVLTQRRRPFDRTFTGPVPSDPDGALVPAADPTRLYLQGFGCMAERRLRRAYAIVGMESGNATAPGNAANPPDVGVGGRRFGIRGFVALRDLPATLAGEPTRVVARRHDVGCGPRDLRVPRGAGAVRRIVAHQRWRRFADLYLGSRSWRSCPPDPATGRPDPEAPACGTPYAQYEAPPGLTPPGQEVALLAANTTGVTGTHAGVVRALYRAGAFRQVDEIAYADPNVPCSPAGGPGERRARWVFGDVNPRPHRGQSHVWGWRPVRVAAPPGGDWRALTVGLDAWRCGAAPATIDDRSRPAAPACPPAGRRAIAGDATVRVYRDAGAKWVCDPISGGLEELDDPAGGEVVLEPPALAAAAGRVAEVVRDDLAAHARARRVLVVLAAGPYVGRDSGSGVVLEHPLATGAGSVRLFGAGAAYIDCPAGSPRACRTPGRGWTYRVHVVAPGDPPRDRVVARGRQIAPRSLRVVDGRLRWSVRG